MEIIKRIMFGEKLEDFDIDGPGTSIVDYEVDECTAKQYFSINILELSENITEKLYEIYDDKSLEPIRCRCYYSKELQAAVLLNSKEFNLRRGISIDLLEIAVNPFGLLFARILAHAPMMRIVKYYELTTGDDLTDGDLHFFLAEYFGKRKVKTLLEHINKRIDDIKPEDFKRFS